MTENVQTTRRVVSASGFSNPLSLPNVYVEDATHLEIYADTTLMSVGTHYTVADLQDAGGPNVTITSTGLALAPTNWVILHNPPLNQPNDLSVGGQFGLAYENAIDGMARRMQAIAERINRSLIVAVDYQGDAATLPTASAGKALKWNEAADGLENSTYDIDEAAAASAASATAAASSASAAAGSASSAASAATAAAGSASSASSSATAAAGSATSAASSASAASSDADDAAAVLSTMLSTYSSIAEVEAAATAAGASATAAAASETAAETAETNSETAQAAAEAAQSASETAQAAAEAAQSAAETAQSGAETAETNAAGSATAAAGSATAAAGSATAAGTAQTAAEAAQSAAEAAQAAAEAAAESVPIDWQGDWATSTAYALNDGVTQNGSSYVCIVAHTSGVFATDLAANRWQLIALRGTDGAGSGDMSAATYDPNTIEADAFDMDNMVEGSTNLILTGAERTKLSGIGSATASAEGLVELATSAEVQTGTDTDRAVTPAGLTAKEATTAQILGNTADRLVTTDQAWAAGAEVGLSDGATIAVDLSSGINFSVTLGGNRTLGNPTNAKAGQMGRIRVVQDGTGSRTLAFGANYEFVGGSAPTISTGAADEDILYYDVISSTRILIHEGLDIG